jgi:hypothetical protein
MKMDRRRFFKTMLGLCLGGLVIKSDNLIPQPKYSNVQLLRNLKPNFTLHRFRRYTPIPLATEPLVKGITVEEYGRSLKFRIRTDLKLQRDEVELL